MRFCSADSVHSGALAGGEVLPGCGTEQEASRIGRGGVFPEHPKIPTLRFGGVEITGGFGFLQVPARLGRGSWGRVCCARCCSSRYWEEKGLLRWVR